MSCYFFIARQHASMQRALLLRQIRPPVCASVCLSNAGIVRKRKFWRSGRSSEAL